MRVTLLGTGTSQGVPVIGCSCDVCRSTDPRDQRLRVSAWVEVNGPQGPQSWVIDTGPDFRQQMLRAGVSRVDAVLFTHPHKDHVAGLDDIRPFNFQQGMAMPLYGPPHVFDRLRVEFDYAFRADYPGVPVLAVHELPTSAPFLVNGVEVVPVPVQHGPMEVYGYRIGDFAYLTDVGSIPAASKARLRNLDVLILDALRHEPHYSHFTLEQALAAIAELQPRQAFLTHVSHLMGRAAEINPGLPAGVQLAYDGQVLELADA